MKPLAESTPSSLKESAPRTVIFCQNGSFTKDWLDRTPHTPCSYSPKLCQLADYPHIVVADAQQGSRPLLSKIEECILWGVQQFIFIGIAESLHPKATAGDIALCDKALRDEQVSSRYLPPAKYIHAPRRMLNKLLVELKKADLPHHVGTSWTTDGLFCNASEQIENYKKEGILMVDSQAAALFACAHFYQVDLSALFSIHGVYNAALTEPVADSEAVRTSLRTLFDLSLSAAQE